MKIEQINAITFKLHMARQTFVVDPNFELRSDIAAVNDVQQVASILEDTMFGLVTQVVYPYFSREHLAHDFPLILQNKAEFLQIQEAGFNQAAYIRGQEARLGKLTLTKVFSAEDRMNVKGYFIQAPHEPSVLIVSKANFDEHLYTMIQTTKPQVCMLDVDSNQMGATNFWQWIDQAATLPVQSVFLRYISTDYSLDEQAIWESVIRDKQQSIVQLLKAGDSFVMSNDKGTEALSC